MIERSERQHRLSHSVRQHLGVDAAALRTGGVTPVLAVDELGRNLA